MHLSAYFSLSIQVTFQAFEDACHIIRMIRSSLACFWLSYTAYTIGRYVRVGLRYTLLVKYKTIVLRDSIRHVTLP